MAKYSKGYRKTVNHSTGVVTESYRNPITGTRHVTKRKKLSVWPVIKWFLIISLGAGLIGAIFGLGDTEGTKPAAESTSTIARETVPETAPTTAEEETTSAPTEETQRRTFERDLVVNTATGKIHRPTCHTIKSTATLVKYHCEVEELEAKGYTTCGVCLW